GRMGGASPQLGDTLIPVSALARRPRKPAPKRPLPPSAPLPGGGPPPDFNYHSTGLAFDLLRPTDDRRRKLLEYALGWLQDRGVLWQMEEADAGPRRYH